MAGSGVGKSSLLSQIARGTDAEVSVVALVGERGREAGEIPRQRPRPRRPGPFGCRRGVRDAPPVERLRAAFVATRIARAFRDSGKHVVLMMDSLTRVAMAQREIGLSAGEPPATRGYPPCLRLATPAPRACRDLALGSITGLYTVLVEGDDMQDPIGDIARSILDGHIVLSRRLATAATSPVSTSSNRFRGSPPPSPRPSSEPMPPCCAGLWPRIATSVSWSRFGAYVAGTDVDADAAVALLPRIEAFLRQAMDDQGPTAQTGDDCTLFRGTVQHDPRRRRRPPAPWPGSAPCAKPTAD